MEETRIRQIKSDGGKTTFEVEINLLEEVVPETNKPQSILGE